MHSLFNVTKSVILTLYMYWLPEWLNKTQLTRCYPQSFSFSWSQNNSDSQTVVPDQEHWHYQELTRMKILGPHPKRNSFYRFFPNLFSVVLVPDRYHFFTRELPYHQYRLSRFNQQGHFTGVAIDNDKSNKVVVSETV